MNTAEVISGIAAVGSIGAVTVGFYRLRYERLAADRDDARDSLAEGALALGRMKSAMRDAITAFHQPLQTGNGWDNYTPIVSNLESTAENLEDALAGVQIRFEQHHPIVTELNAALQSVRSLIIIYFVARQADVGGGRRRERIEERGEEDDVSRAHKASMEFDEHKAAYLAAAQEVVGARLNGKTKPHFRSRESLRQADS